jgi:hypothetical protein
MLVGVEFTSSERSGNRKNRRRPKKSNTGMMQPVVQRLFETCQEVFSGPGTVPSPGDVLRLKSILGTIPKLLDIFKKKVLCSNFTISAFF